MERVVSFRVRLALLVAGAVLWTGCGSIWTYDGALQKRIRDHGFTFVPPDSEAFAPPRIPQVYDVVFTEDIIATRDSLEEASGVVPLQIVTPDTVFIFVPLTPAGIDVPQAQAAPAETTAAIPPTVRVELTPGEQAALVARIEADMKRSEALLAEMRERNSACASSEQWEAARGLLLQAGSTLSQKDYQGAANLAQKARLVAENLAAACP